MSNIELTRVVLKGVFILGEKLSEVFGCYDIQIIGSSKGRYAHIVETEQGAMQLRPMDVGDGRLKSEYTFKESLFNQGFTAIDRVVPNNEEELSTMDRYGNMHVMRRYFYGREMSASNMTEVMMAVENLANFHKAGAQVWSLLCKDEEGKRPVIRDDNDFAKRNKELKRVRAYISKVSPKQRFEEIYLKVYNDFYLQAVDCERKMGSLQEYRLETLKDGRISVNTPHLGYCHGSYNNHSILMCHSEAGNYIATVGFDRFYVGNQLADLYYFARKIVEKNGYDFNVLKEIIETYNSYIPLSKSDLEYIYLLFCYPEKFYKLSSQYINGTKVRISPVMMEKISRIIGSEEKKSKLLSQFRNIFLHIS